MLKNTAKHEMMSFDAIEMRRNSESDVTSGVGRR